MSAPCSRHAGIDLLRGVVMVLMVIDHARDYASTPGTPGDPMDLSMVGPGLFFTRWVSHFCAPIFALLMGVSVSLSARSRSPQDLSRHLVTRGLLLLLLEFTLVDWGWTWNPLWPRKFFQVIGALGCSMLGLAAFTRWGHRVTLVAGIMVVTLHNLADDVRFDDGGLLHYVWSFVHQRNVLPLFAGFELRTSYPFLPILGVAFVGYGLAPYVLAGNRMLRSLGAALIVAFVMLRAVFSYGDPHPLEFYSEPGLTWMSLLNVTKYPLSLQFICMTIGPALCFLHWTHGKQFPRLRMFTTIGQVPLFFYVSHLWLLHALALLGALAAGYPLASFQFMRQFGGRPVGFEFPLWLVYPFAGVTVLLLYPLCRSWASPVAPPSVRPNGMPGQGTTSIFD